VAKYGLAVALHVLIEPDAAPALLKIISSVALRPLQRMTPQIVAVQFDQVEGVKEDGFVMAAVANAIE
jgi:hypothetical protein